MRRWTLVTIIALLLTLAVVGVVTILSAQGPNRPPGPELTPLLTPGVP